ncbi:hypothetical protein [Sphingobium chungbukense]|uniref:Uncharacterized protein n=1 Tax=Sphingobium chungbukense TaxID=56193 RepID=A0A0M3ARV9_9SPHN|nr:hypothetical protein [Sphingobium chungbukense]KKW92952.1 hypothetical protein YP76_08700 [Sphingobium chungbukense]
MTRWLIRSRAGEATWNKALLLLERSGFPEGACHSFSYSPLHIAEGAVGGLLCIVNEETALKRRLRASSANAVSKRCAGFDHLISLVEWAEPFLRPNADGNATVRISSGSTIGQGNGFRISAHLSVSG